MRFETTALYSRAPGALPTIGLIDNSRVVLQDGVFGSSSSTQMTQTGELILSGGRSVEHTFASGNVLLKGGTHDSNRFIDSNFRMTGGELTGIPTQGARSNPPSFSGETHAVIVGADDFEAPNIGPGVLFDLHVVSATLDGIPIDFSDASTVTIPNRDGEQLIAKLAAGGTAVVNLIGQNLTPDGGPYGQVSPDAILRVRQVPSPSGMLLAGIGGFALTRRRR